MSGSAVPFQFIGNSITVTPVAATSVPQALGRTTGFGESIKFTNTSGSDLAVRFGAGAQTAVTTDPTIKSGDEQIISVPAGCDNIAVFARAAVTGTLDVQCGAGGI